MRERSLVPGAFLIAVGIALGGWFVGHGFASARAVERFVTVKGVSEREVEADVALWPLRFVATDNSLSEAQARIEADTDRVLAFLAQNGIPGAEVTVQDLVVTDLLANPYRSGPTPSRFIVSKTLMVRSEQPKVVAGASQRVGDLVQAGVVLSTEGRPGSGPTYLFTRLNDFKPKMIAEATAAAREAAQQFAADSRSRLGGIRRANQGVFQILPRDAAQGFSEEGQLAKTLRVVTTVDYTLVD